MFNDPTISKGNLYLGIHLGLGTIDRMAMDLFEKVRKGELFKPVFQPLRSVAAALSIVSAFRLEYLLVHGEKPLEGESVLQLLWQFFTAL